MGLVCAMAVFSYLYSSRSACMMHALPLRREALFLTQYLAGLSFLLLPFNIFSTYYFQSLLRPVPAMAVSVARGALISGLLIMTLPALLGPDALWLAMPITELVVALPVAALMLKDARHGTKKRTLE